MPSYCSDACTVAPDLTQPYYAHHLTGISLFLSSFMVCQWSAVLVEMWHTKGQRVLPLPMGWEQGRASGRDETDTPRSQAGDDVAALESSVVTWRHLLQDLLSATPQAAIQACPDSLLGVE